MVADKDLRRNDDHPEILYLTFGRMQYNSRSNFDSFTISHQSMMMALYSPPGNVK